MHLNKTETCKIVQNIIDIFNTKKLYDFYHIEHIYWRIERKDYMIDYNFRPIVSKKLLNNKSKHKESKNVCPCINSLFYEGLGIPL